jgi:hypothetical protein
MCLSWAQAATLQGMLLIFYLKGITLIWSHSYANLAGDLGTMAKNIVRAMDESGVKNLNNVMYQLVNPYQI